MTFLVDLALRSRIYMSVKNINIVIDIILNVTSVCLGEAADPFPASAKALNVGVLMDTAVVRSLELCMMMWSVSSNHFHFQCHG